MSTAVRENKEPSSYGCQPERSEKKQAKGAGGPAYPVTAPYKGADGNREAENLLVTGARVTRESLELLCHMWGKPSGKNPDKLVPLQITADSNLKYQLSLSVHWERKQQAEEEEAAWWSEHFCCIISFQC